MSAVALSLDEELEFVELAERLLENSRERHRRLLLLSFLMLGAGVALAPGVGCNPTDRCQVRPTSHSFGSM